MSTIIDTLVCDRSQSDVDRVFLLKHKILTQGLSTLSDDEKTEYMAGMKGAYNHTDMNRVGQAVEYLENRVKLLGDAIPLSAKTDWVIGDTPTQEQASTYITNIKKLRESVTVLSDTPEVPASLDRLTYESANDIEQVLVNVEDGINRVVQGFCYTGISFCGE